MKFLPVLSAEQKYDSQPEEINVIEESQAENRPVSMQEGEIRWKKVSLVRCCLLCLAATQKITHMA